MKTTIILIGLLFLISCSDSRKLERSADMGELNSCYNIVDLYSSSDYSPTDKKAQEKVVKYSKKGIDLATDTNIYGPSYCAKFYKELAKSFLTPESEKYSYYIKSAGYGDGESQWVTGLFYLDGKGGAIDNDSAFYWIKKASNGNIYHYAAIASEEMGDIYFDGKLIKADTSTAIYYYKKSCACYREYSVVSACDKVIKFYKSQQHIKDTSELAIYSELARQLRMNNKTR